MHPSCNNDVIPKRPWKAVTGAYGHATSKSISVIKNMNKLVENKQINQRSTLMRGIYNFSTFPPSEGVSLWCYCWRNVSNIANISSQSYCPKQKKTLQESQFEPETLITVR